MSEREKEKKQKWPLLKKKGQAGKGAQEPKKGMKLEHRVTKTR
jgi:hypothetical protein